MRGADAQNGGVRGADAQNGGGRPMSPSDERRAAKRFRPDKKIDMKALPVTGFIPVPMRQPMRQHCHFVCVGSMASRTTFPVKGGRSP